MNTAVQGRPEMTVSRVALSWSVSPVESDRHRELGVCLEVPPLHHDPRPHHVHGVAGHSGRHAGREAGDQVTHHTLLHGQY